VFVNFLKFGFSLSLVRDRALPHLSSTKSKRKRGGWELCLFRIVVLRCIYDWFTFYPRVGRTLSQSSFASLVSLASWWFCAPPPQAPLVHHHLWPPVKDPGPKISGFNFFLLSYIYKWNIKNRIKYVLCFQNFLSLLLIFLKNCFFFSILKFNTFSPQQSLI